MATDFARLRVAKTMAPDQRGAIKLARKHGAQLVCVRHRHDPTGRERYTTVELVVDRTPIVRRPVLVVGVRIGYAERRLQSLARRAGARWTPRRNCGGCPRTSPEASASWIASPQRRPDPAWRSLTTGRQHWPLVARDGNMGVLSIAR